MKGIKNRKVNFSNYENENNERKHLGSSSDSYRPTLVHEEYKNYNDMRKYCVKVTYNVMGEPVKNKIKLDNLKSFKRGGKSHCGSDSKAHDTRHVIVKRKDATYSFLDLTRTVHVLREVLYGKSSRDIMHGRSWDEFSLQEMLRFYCETSFGTTMIASYRQTHLFNAVLALQSASPFIRIMKRLLGIPGIQSFPDQISEIYFEAWSWFFTNDVFLHGKFELDHQNVVAIDYSTHLKSLLISEQNFFECIDYMQNEKGNFFSQYFISSVKEKISTLNKTKGLRKEYLDVDEALEIFMNKMEQNETRITKVKDQLFGRNVPYSKILIPKGEGSFSLLDHDTLSKSTNKESFYSSLKTINLALDRCIMLDRDRNGSIQYLQFKQIVRDFCHGISQLEHFELTQFQKLFKFFEVEDDSVAIADYVEFVGIVYTIFLDEQSIPCINDILLYFAEPRRGIESQHYALLEEYVRTSNLKKNRTRDYKDQNCINTTKESQQILTKIESIPNNSDFMSRWLRIGSLRNKYKNTLRQMLSEDESKHSVSVQLKKIDNDRPKTPLYLVEPQASFDHKFLGGFDNPLSEQIFVGEKRSCHKCPSLSYQNLNAEATNIYLRFRDDTVEKKSSLYQVATNSSFSAPHGLLIEGHNSLVSEKCNIQSLNDIWKDVQEVGDNYLYCNNISPNYKIQPSKRDGELTPNHTISMIYQVKMETESTEPIAHSCDDKCRIESKRSDQNFQSMDLANNYDSKPDDLSEELLPLTISCNIPSSVRSICENDSSQEFANALTRADTNASLTMDKAPPEGKEYFSIGKTVSIPSKRLSEKEKFCLSSFNPTNKLSKVGKVCNIAEKGGIDEKKCTKNEHSLDSLTLVDNTKFVNYPYECNEFNIRPKNILEEKNINQIQHEKYGNGSVQKKSTITESLFVINCERKTPIISSTETKKFTRTISIKVSNNLIDNYFLSCGRNLLLRKTFNTVFKSSIEKLAELDDLRSRLGHQHFMTTITKFVPKPSSFFSDKILLLLSSALKMRKSMCEGYILKKTEQTIWAGDENVSFKYLMNKQNNDGVNDTFRGVKSLRFNKEDVLQSNDDVNTCPAIQQSNIVYGRSHKINVLQKNIPKIHTKSIYTPGEDISRFTSEAFELTTLHLIDKGQWEILFEHNENVMLSMISRFQALHKNLTLSRHRHRPDRIELENFATCFSIFHRMNRLSRLRTKKKLQYIGHYEIFGSDEITLGVGIKSLLISSQTRKKKLLTNDVFCVNYPPPLLRHLTQKNKIKPIKYRIRHMYQI